MPGEELEQSGADLQEGEISGEAVFFLRIFFVRVEREKEEEEEGKV